jgi:hypothetical protein
MFLKVSRRPRMATSKAKRLGMQTTLALAYGV